MSIRDYKITDAQFSEKGVIAAPDTLTGTAAENKGVFDRFAREIIAPQFNAIVDKFADMEESANNWSANEAQRVQQENARQTAEQRRVSAEGQRATNETARLSAEENRISAENDRVTAETARVNAENKRDSAEKSRVSAENARNVWQTYDAAKTYIPGNKVSFGGSSYVCTAATIGHEPTDTAYWLLIAQKGMDGAGADDLRQINNALDAINPTKITTKVEPADGDGVMIADSADGGKAKRLLWSSVKTALGKLFVPLARKVNGKALAKDVTLTGENIAVSTADSTPISSAVKYRTNPNLLDNWFFGNPVNQKKGYYIPAGVKYNTLSWTEVGTTDKAYPVIGYIGQDPLITVNGTNYIVGKSVQVPGYCTAGYTVDRWRTGYDGTFAVNVSDTGVSLVSGNDGSWKNFYETIETSKLIVGRTYTFSFLAEDNGGVRQVYISDYGSVFDGDKGLYTITFVAKETTQNQDFGIRTNVGKTSIPLAAKLELGSTQTLAHQDSSGNWILNEIPDFGEQLRRCQWYHREIERSNYGMFALGMSTSATEIDFIIPLNPPMRVAPSVSFEGSFATNGVSFNSISSLGVVESYPDEITLRATGSGFVRGEERTLQVSSAATSKIIISAEL